MVSANKYIEVEKQKRVFKNFERHLLEFSKTEAAEAVATIIKCMDISADIYDKSVPCGEWNSVNQPYFNGFECSECGRTVVEKENYCPNCGIKMFGDIV